MCFSAPASFTLGALLISTGTYCIKNTLKSNKAYLALAFLPLFFGLQQAFEGGVWSSLNSNNPSAALIFSLAFLFFSYFLWLLWVPLSTYLLEHHKIRKKALKILIIFGGLGGAFIYFNILINNNLLEIKIVNSSIFYNTSMIFKDFRNNDFFRIIENNFNYIYAAFIVLPLLISSHRFLKFFGLLYVLSMVIAILFYEYAFLSVWCFFAAVLSLFIVYILNRVARPSSPHKT